MYTCVEGTTYNHGRPEGISEDQHPMNQFLACGSTPLTPVLI